MKYVCINNKSRVANNPNASLLVFVVGDKYDGKPHRFMRGGVNIDSKVDGTYAFSITNDNNEWFFNDYFISMREYRNRKLKELGL